MKVQGIEKRKSPVTASVRNNEMKTISTWTIEKEGTGDFKIQKILYRVPGTVKRERRSAGGGGDI